MKMLTSLRAHVVLSCALLGGVIVLEAQTNENGSRTSASHISARTRWPPLPPEVLAYPLYASVYRFVASNASLVSRMPCYCGCKTTGHKSLAVCFLSQSADRKRVTWSTHATNCGLCITMAQDVERLKNERRSAQEIKRHLETAYGHLQ